MFPGLSFQHMVLVWQYAWDFGLIEREKPDIVMDEMLERYLDWPLAAVPAAKSAA